MIEYNATEQSPTREMVADLDNDIRNLLGMEYLGFNEGHRLAVGFGELIELRAKIVKLTEQANQLSPLY